MGTTEEDLDHKVNIIRERHENYPPSELLLTDSNLRQLYADRGELLSELARLRLFRAELMKLTAKPDQAAAPELKLFVWGDVLRDYTPGIAFALAESVEHARELILESWQGAPEQLERELVLAAPKVFDAPVAVARHGGS